LPKPVIVQLMIILDPVSLQCLRRTGRLFLQTFELYFILPVPAAESLPQPRPPLLFLEDEFCYDCRAFRRLPHRSYTVWYATRRFLYCLGCQRDHLTCLFTFDQPKSESRLCIGHTGYIRLCEHQVVKWSQIVAASKNIKNKTYYVIVECKKKSHLKPCQQ
ncbi:hypothetical protein QBC43DRAFT_171427, partial [Cladorrhinum sp. PSN259]